MIFFRVGTAVCLSLLFLAGVTAQEAESSRSDRLSVAEYDLIDTGHTFGDFRSLDTGVSRWRDRDRDGYSEMVHLGVRRAAGRTEIVESSVGTQRMRERHVGSIDLGNARIRRIELVSSRPPAGTDTSSYLLYLTHTGATLSDGLYRVPADTLDPGRVLEREELARFHYSEFGRVAEHRAFDVTDSGMILAAHSAAPGTQLIVHSNDEAHEVSGLPEGATTVEVRAVADGERIVAALRTHGETEVARVRIGALVPDSTGYRFDEYANLPGQYAALFEGGDAGPRSPLGMDTAYRDRGLDAALLDDGRVLVVYQYIEQNLTVVTQPAAGLKAAVVDSAADTEPESYTLQEVEQNRFAFSPHITRSSSGSFEMVWVVEVHDRDAVGAGARSDVARTRANSDGEPLGSAENLSSTPRKVSDPAIGACGRVMWLQSEPRVPGMRPVVTTGPPVLASWLIPAHGNRLESLAAAVFSLPVAVLVGALDATVLWFGGLMVSYMLVLVLFRFAPDLVRRGGSTVPAAAILIHLPTYGVAPLSFAGSTPAPVPFLAASLFTVVVLALFRRRLLPNGRITPGDVMRVVWIASLLFAVQLAYPVVAGTMLELSVVPPL